MKTPTEVVSEAISGVLSTVVSAFILAIPAFIVENLYNNIEIITGLYILFLLVAIYILHFKQQNIPIYIKRIRFIILLILILIPVISFVHYNSSHTIPNLKVKIINDKSSEIDLSNEGEFHIAIIKGARNEKVAREVYLTLDDPGKIELKNSDNNHQGSLRIPPKGELIVNAEIVKPERYLDSFQSGYDYYIYLTLYQTDNINLGTQGGLHFDKDTISDEYLIFKIQRQIQN